MGLNFCDDRDYYIHVGDKWFTCYYPERYEESDGSEWDDDRTENVSMELDEPIILFEAIHNSKLIIVQPAQH